MGIGSLYERVVHEETGFVAKNKEEFVKYSNLVLEDNKVYLSLKKIYPIKETQEITNM